MTLLVGTGGVEGHQNSEQTFGEQIGVSYCVIRGSLVCLGVFAAHVRVPRLCTQKYTQYCWHDQL